tara:strand:- start:2696 stop:3133 length:438 start_codon:yes stop_codon:yes gene_type:complete
MSRASDLANLIASGNTTIHGEAGVTSSDSTGLTTNLQQGLIKSWVSFDGNTVDASTNMTGENGSFNVSALEDDGTGDYDVLFTNNMANTNYTVTSGGTRNASSTAQAGYYQKHNVATTGYTVMTFNTAAVEDHDLVMTQVAGDLA